VRIRIRILSGKSRLFGRNKHPTQIAGTSSQRTQHHWSIHQLMEGDGTQWRILVSEEASPIRN
jgi:hypothetical protein